MQRYTGFIGQRQVASGDLIEVALELQAHVDRGEEAPAILIDDSTGNAVGTSLHGTPAQLRARLEREQAGGAEEPEKTRKPGPGRPKLGVISREVSLLPRHWEWLGKQQGGASVTLRRLVEQAGRDGEAMQRARRARDAAYRFMYVMAGDLPGFEEATRALFAGDAKKLEQEMRAWPRDIRAHARKLVEIARERARDAEEVEAARKR